MREETHRQIVDAVEKLIQTKGLARVTTKEIAQATGLSEGALYRHFDHKEDVFFAVLQKHLPILVGTLDNQVAGTKTVRENLVEIALAVLSYYEQLIPMNASFFADTVLLTRFREALRQIGGKPQHLHERVAAYIEEEQRLGRIKPQLPALSIAILLLAAVHHYGFLRQLLGENPFDTAERQFVENIVQVVTQGILPSE
ncbi:MAG: TetR/AcrR family transcriptional regulator [Chloroflexi bacterium]|nr:TetR/AcrR family transcriptional regulator [Chloroflexota bacterium]MCI0576179.1 TetR/AcrR family transcriptional regulator [Chloroflexota bacterium]MCI0648968.1 TetR/AcrR family transcriptional regulator [Chloroflexota bacterium]MCI0728184.1 TetR/AcrR family transcriptional regulator [Chloroflexota bacterium]